MPCQVLVNEDRQCQNDINETKQEPPKRTCSRSRTVPHEVYSARHFRICGERWFEQKSNEFEHHY